MQPLRCPDCRRDLAERALDSGAAWLCERCRGLSVNLAVLRQQLPKETLRHFWGQAISAAEASSRECPSCHRSMRLVTSGGSPALELDLCVACQLLWFDLHELVGVGGTRGRALGADARAAVAQAQVEVMQEATEIQEQARALVLLIASQVWPHPVLAAHLQRRA